MSSNYIAINISFHNIPFPMAIKFSFTEMITARYNKVIKTPTDFAAFTDKHHHITC